MCVAATVQRTAGRTHLYKQSKAEIWRIRKKAIMSDSKATNKFGFQILFLFAILLAAASAFAAPHSKNSAGASVPAFPGTLVNAKYIYVTSYDGDQFDVNLLPDDRQAISTVQDAIQSWGKFTLVYEPWQADMVLMVTSRPSEDVLAVYDAHGWPENGQYLWRMMGRAGLQKGETPLMTNLENAFTAATSAKSK